MTQAILEIKHLKKSYGQNEVLKDISLTVHKGEVNLYHRKLWKRKIDLPTLH